MEEDMRMSSQARMMKCSAEAMMMRRGSVDRQSEDSGYYENSDNDVRFHQNFLMHTPLQVYNLKPDQNGMVTFSFDKFEQYSQLFVVAVNNESVV